MSLREPSHAKSGFRSAKWGRFVIGLRLLEPARLDRSDGRRLPLGVCYAFQTKHLPPLKGIVGRFPAAIGYLNGFVQRQVCHAREFLEAKGIEAIVADEQIASNRQTATAQHLPRIDPFRDMRTRFHEANPPVRYANHDAHVPTP